MANHRPWENISKIGLQAGRIVVAGAPASGKTKYVNDLRQPGDVVWDFDDVAQTLAGTPRWNVTPELIDCVNAANDAVISWLSVTKISGKVFIVVCSPKTASEIAIRIGGSVVIMKTPRDVCLRRIADDPHRGARADEQSQAINEWFKSYGSLI